MCLIWQMWEDGSAFQALAARLQGIKTQQEELADLRKVRGEGATLGGAPTGLVVCVCMCVCVCVCVCVCGCARRMSRVRTSSGSASKPAFCPVFRFTVVATQRWQREYPYSFNPSDPTVSSPQLHAAKRGKEPQSAVHRQAGRHKHSRLLVLCPRPETTRRNDVRPEIVNLNLRLSVCVRVCVCVRA